MSRTVIDILMTFKLSDKFTVNSGKDYAPLIVTFIKFKTYQTLYLRIK